MLQPNYPGEIFINIKRAQVELYLDEGDTVSSGIGMNKLSVCPRTIGKAENTYH